MDYPQQKMPRFNVNFEMGKFFMYCMFPVGFLYIFNRPELQESFFFRDQMKTLEEMQYKEDESKLNVTTVFSWFLMGRPFLNILFGK